MSVKRFSLYIIFFLLPISARAEWTVVLHTDIDSQTETKVAFTENEEGYSLEVYKDENGAIRSRFSTNKKFSRFSSGLCPTYQVDKLPPRNHSINDAKCLSHRKWAEFILGYVIDNKVESRTLDAIKNGNQLIYRFNLETGGYDETQFSLLGSNRALTIALGESLDIVPR